MSKLTIPDAVIQECVVVIGGDTILWAGPAAEAADGTSLLLDVLRTTVADDVPLVDAVRSAATMPAAVLGDPRVGALEVGRRADVVITDLYLHIIDVLRAAWFSAPEQTGDCLVFIPYQQQGMVARWRL